MRISDWSSDVCSSDRTDQSYSWLVHHPANRSAHKRKSENKRQTHYRGNQNEAAFIVALDENQDRRSEEHTSELQSLMRISYAVFCLKKKKTTTTTKQIHTTLPQQHSPEQQ